MTTKIAPPKRTTKGQPPLRAVPTDTTKAPANLDKPEPLKGATLNFKVTAEFKRDFQIEAATHGMKLQEFLEALFENWKAR